MQKSDKMISRTNKFVFERIKVGVDGESQVDRYLLRYIGKNILLWWSGGGQSLNFLGAFVLFRVLLASLQKGFIDVLPPCVAIVIFM